MQENRIMTANEKKTEEMTETQKVVVAKCFLYSVVINISPIQYKQVFWW